MNEKYKEIQSCLKAIVSTARPMANWIDGFIDGKHDKINTHEQLNRAFSIINDFLQMAITEYQLIDYQAEYAKIILESAVVANDDLDKCSLNMPKFKFQREIDNDKMVASDS
jgi:hypothetical protein